ncbi:MAG: ferritin [Desulfobulbaceae bacterium S3730MH12]|nr:MAG: ferritin [Desulfobulbaceae bacterium S5133MH15]OEU57419.1 MAG: ferritin [Desulfobulbaceae bacterium S3730MH12]OEU82752.1 MAG: ferritin [Desulfobulbaceae bacterium C00003063]
MISKKMNGVINGQINAELYSSYLYLSMSTWFSERSLSGFASWMRAQAQEELYHSTKMLDYLLERGGSAEFEAIDKPQCSWSSPLEVIQETADHEAKVTGLINDLVDAALAERDHATNNFLQWFVAEQVEEEASVGEVVEKMKMIGDDSAGMFAMDLEMGKRVFTLPAE